MLYLSHYLHVMMDIYQVVLHVDFNTILKEKKFLIVKDFAAIVIFYKLLE
jgi:hypothetical protein